ncbi:YueH family protein [Bacillus cereus]|uniref:YueH family protein n=1 Tax=Bacillus cereus TaxID=1396 RepID=A0AAW5L3S4_BACCE|nr:YueH family protein [Bacillus cereus]MCQ6288916.1 YueH family protein [Bacillus cereus]MCQ6318330.1 YueH family protein [Bacillus cereus]MCQ6330004.1 YueH family protein [Bacillus cereus]MCQ6385956.1 YueH family protein [Bacillus cereus]
MKTYGIHLEDGRVLSVFIEELNKRNALVAIPKIKWSYVLRYYVKTHDDFKCERDKLVCSLFETNELQYSEVERVADWIQKWV